MAENNKSFNFLFHKNILNNNHMNSIFNRFRISKKVKKIKLINKSNSCIFPVLDIYNNNENNKEKNSVNIHENKFKKIMLISKPKKLINKQDKSLSIYDNFSNIKNKFINEEGKDNKTYSKNNYSKNNKNYDFYQSIYLGKETDRNKIDNLNSPLLKYFLYNIFQNNKRSIKLSNKSYLSNKKSTNKNFNIYKPDFVLTNKSNNHIFNRGNFEKMKVKNFIPKNIIKNKFNKNSLLNSEENSSSENNQIDSTDIEKMLKLEERTENLNLKSNETNFSNFLKTNNPKKTSLGQFYRAKPNKRRNIEKCNCHKDNIFNKKSIFSLRKTMYHKN